MTLSQFFNVIRGRYKIVVATMAAVMVLTVIVCLLMPKRYTATTHVVVDLLSQDLIAGSSASLSANSSSSYIPTQVAIISSANVAQRVASKLHLDQNAASHAAWLRATEGHGDELAWHANELEKHLSVKSTLDSNIVSISFTSPSAPQSALIANAFTNAYLDTTVELRDEPAKGMAKWLSARVEEARTSLNQVQDRVTEFQHDHSIVTNDERFDTETQQLAMLSQQLVDVQGQNADTKSKLESISIDGTTRDVAHDTMIMRIKNDLSDLQQKLSESSAFFGKNHPTSVQFKIRVEALQSQLEQETARVKASLTSDAAAGATKEQLIVAAMAERKERLSGLRAQRAVLEQLIKDRDAAQSAYQELNQKYIQTRLLAYSVQTNVSVLSPALEPLRPSAPKPLLYGAAAAVAATLLGIALAFLCEIQDRRVRSEEELEMVLRTAVLGRRPLNRSLMSKLAAWSEA